jgi:predicted phosphoadenosine phosphosulfate sulfurtransferase
MKTQREKSIDYWNALGKTKRDELSLEYYGTLSYYLMDDEVEQIWIREIPQPKVYSEEDMIKAAQYGYNYHMTTSFPEQSFENNCKRNAQQWLTTLKK